MVSKMNNKYTTEFEVKWADVDPNLHLRHTVYLDFGDQTRIRYFNEHGLSFNKLLHLGIGPILFGTQTDFKREVVLSEKITIDLELVETSEDGRKWKMKHLVFKENGELAAEMIYRGAWLNIKERKVVAPPAEVVTVINAINDFKYEEEN